MQAWKWALSVVLLGFTFVHSTESQSAPQRAPSSRSSIAIQRSSDVCSALSPAECCAQMLEIAMFRATGDQVPKSAKTPVRLSCKESTRTIPENACRLIALGRGFTGSAAAQLCAPEGLAKRCSDDSACRQCMGDLDRLEWKASARACYALTYVAKREAADGSRTRRLVMR